MKRIIAITLTILLVSGIFLVGCGEKTPAPTTGTTPTPAAPAAKPIEFRWASFIPPFDVYSQQADAWAKRLSEASNGRVKVTFYWAESLVKAPDLLDATIAGTIDFAQTDPYWTPEKLSMAMVTGIPMLFDRSSQAGQSAIALYNKYKELRDQFYPTKVICWQVPGPTNLSSTKVPIKTLADVKGLRIWGTGWNETEVVKAIGGVPVNVPPGERYTALERGVADATVDDFNAIWAWKVHEVTKYRTDGLRFNMRSTPWIMNVDSYNKLPADLKTIFDKVTDPMEMSRTANLAYEKWQEETNVLLKEWDKKAGNEWYVVPDAERGAWLEKIKLVQDTWVNQLEAKGLPGKAFFEDAKAFAKQYK